MILSMWRNVETPGTTGVRKDAQMMLVKNTPALGTENQQLQVQALPCSPF
jgi:hypothetical protein